MSDVYSSVGTKLSVAAARPATHDSTGFAALTFALAGEVSEIPEFGAESALATHTPLATGVVAKRAGSVNYGSVALTLALSEDDDGQAILNTQANLAPGQDKNASVKVEFPTGEVRYFTAQVMSFKENVGNADAIAMGSVTLEIDSTIVKVAAP